MIKIIVNDVGMDFKKGTKFYDLAKTIEEDYKKPIMAFTLNNHFKALGDEINEDGIVKIIDISNTQGLKVYQRSLSYIFIRAVKNIYGDVKVDIQHSISNGIFCTIDKKPALAMININEIKDEMNRLISLGEDFEKITMKMEDAREYFRKEGYKSKAELLKYNEESTLTMYKYGSMIDYFYGYMLKNASQITAYDLVYYKGGVILSHPNENSNGKVPPFVEQRLRSKVFRESEKWSEILNFSYIHNVNKSIEENEIYEQVLVNEAFHEKRVVEIADEICKEKKRLILIAGPSSSGKTTFANRLRIQLRVNGLNPVALGTDDYYLNRNVLPILEDGKPDLETINALDLHKFNCDISDLLEGKEIDMPSFDFVSGTRQKGKKFKITSDQPIIIEGIHGLNPLLTHEISSNDKFKIYISCLTQLNIDEHNRIHTTDSRLIRRMVRDYKFRGTSALETMKMWKSVRRGEDKYIYPYQEDADEVYNSALTYELSVLKKYALPMLKEITNEHEEYSIARHLISLFSYVKDSDVERIIPSTSILKEFIGGNIFHEKH